MTFHVYHSDGTPATFDEAVAAARTVDAVLLGEEHTDPTTHGLQEEFLRRSFVAFGRATNRPPGAAPAGHPSSSDAQDSRRPILLSLEMVEKDVQYVLDEYLADLITEDHFLKSVRPWPRYQSDYRGILEFAKAHGIPIVAANAPRRYVERAGRLGRDSLEELPEPALSFLPPLPYPEASAAYQDEWNELMGEALEHLSGSPMDAQTLWDAAMAYSIAEAAGRSGRALSWSILPAAFHVENGTGTPEALEYYRPGTTTLIVAHRPAGDPAGVRGGIRGAG